MINLLELDLPRVWKGSLEEEFVNIFSQTAYLFLENPANTRSKSLKRSIFLLVAILVKKYNQALSATTSIIHLLMKHEHLPGPVAELLEVLVKEYDNQQIVGDFLREIGQLNPSESRDTSGIKSISQFLAELTQRLPKLILPNISVLLTHLDGEVKKTKTNKQTKRCFD